MIETVSLDRAATLAWAEAGLTSVMQLEADQLALAAHWADLHDPVSLPPATGALERRRRELNGDVGAQPGGDGTPRCCAPATWSWERSCARAPAALAT